MVNQVRKYSETCMLPVSQDISGSFDNWQLHILECPRNNYWTIKSFLTNKTFTLEWGDHWEVKVLSRPILWNIIFEGLLRLNLPDCYMIYEYADDMLRLVTPAWNRRDRWEMHGELHFLGSPSPIGQLPLITLQDVAGEIPLDLLVKEKRGRGRYMEMGGRNSPRKSESY
ncbi:hypothetical protein PR048_018799 [Dryococelus australis]|uniref:Uncharacterized protein n=1 Tax=Dryococelus australis TaxID=614101 RepID=A0ABQ9H1Q2_9NEOP|nr:hypothetical protein PR048_018799 [Dryococelus australis]